MTVKIALAALTEVEKFKEVTTVTLEVVAIATLLLCDLVAVLGLKRRQMCFLVPWIIVSFTGLCPCRAGLRKGHQQPSHHHDLLPLRHCHRGQPCLGLCFQHLQRTEKKSAGEQTRTNWSLGACIKFESFFINC